MSKFRTIELSDNRYSSDNLHFVTVKTQNLKGRGDVVLFIPPGIKPGEILPVVILLHGVYGSAWSWAYKAGVHLQAAQMIERKEIPPMIIAMPSDGLWGDGSGYLSHNGYNFERWIVTDVVDLVTEQVPGAKKESPLFIAGLSMGGFGALRIGAKFGTKFSGISGHSSITNLMQMKLFVEEDLVNYKQENPIDEDVFLTIQQHREHLPPLRFDCGVSDQLIEYNRELHRQMKQHNIEHVYEEHAGAHDWSYWKEQIRESLYFFAEQL